jgi:hypothetical protein
MAKQSINKRLAAPMLSDEYRAVVEALGFASLAAAGRFLGVAPRTGENYANGGTRIPQAVAMLLRLMYWRRIAPADVA